MKVNVLGSCISRVIMLNGDTAAHGIADDEIELAYFLDKQNIVLAMMMPSFAREEVESIQKEEIFDGSRIHSLKQCLNKDTVELLLDSDHIILNCFRSNTYYLAKDGTIREIPEEFKRPYHSNDKYNKQLYDVEEYIISRYNPYVIV